MSRSSLCSDKLQFYLGNVVLSYNQNNVDPDTYSSLSTFLHPDGLHAYTCGLSLWQRKNGKLPDSKPCKDQRQDQGRPADANVLSRKSCCLFLMELCVCRMGTLLSTRQLSRATPTSSTSCSSRAPQPTSSPWSVRPWNLTIDDLMSSDDISSTCLLCDCSEWEHCPVHRLSPWLHLCG